MGDISKLLALLQVPKLGAQRIGRLLAEVDFSTFCDYGKAELRQLGWNDAQIQRWLSPDFRKIEAALAWREDRQQQHMISLFDPAYPFLLKQISTAPPILFVKGDLETLARPQIAMVGSREYSHYGAYWAKAFAAELVKNDLVVTSGLAIGIDGFCHQQAVDSGGKTVAVLGSGLRQIYPVRHQALAEQIVATGGALVSEFFPDQPPLAEHFPRRNRIISGLSLGTLVVEATRNSGSLITARYALEQGREVFALPNSVQNPYSQGCHQLIKEGALLVEQVDDILQAIALQRQPVPVQAALFTEPEGDITPTVPAQAVVKPAVFAKTPQNLTACQQQLYDQIGLVPVSIDDLAKACQISVETALVELLHLELAGEVKAVSGGYVRSECGH